jgi:hypothetical protein
MFESRIRGITGFRGLGELTWMQTPKGKGKASLLVTLARKPTLTPTKAWGRNTKGGGLDAASQPGASPTGWEQCRPFRAWVHNFVEHSC